MQRFMRIRAVQSQHNCPFRELLLDSSKTNYELYLCFKLSFSIRELMAPRFRLKTFVSSCGFLPSPYNLVSFQSSSSTQGLYAFSNFSFVCSILLLPSGLMVGKCLRATCKA